MSKWNTKRCKHTIYNNRLKKGFIKMKSYLKSFIMVLFPLYRNKFGSRGKRALAAIKVLLRQRVTTVRRTKILGPATAVAISYGDADLFRVLKVLLISHW